MIFNIENNHRSFSVQTVVGNKSDDDDDDYHSMKSNTPATSRPSTPQSTRNSAKNINDPVNRDTLIDTERKTSDYLSTSSSSSSNKRSPTVSVITSSSIQTVQQDNIDIPSTNNNHHHHHGKPRKPAEQKKPESSPKPPRAITASSKVPSSPTINTNPMMNKEIHTGGAAASDPALQSHDEQQPIQRLRSKYQRRKMTEEEAIKELGLFH